MSAVVHHVVIDGSAVIQQHYLGLSRGTANGIYLRSDLLRPSPSIRITWQSRMRLEDMAWMLIVCGYQNNIFIVKIATLSQLLLTIFVSRTTHLEHAKPVSLSCGG